MKKLFAVFLVTVLACGCLAGCQITGVPQAEYDKIVSERDALQSQLNALSASSSTVDNSSSPQTPSSSQAETSSAPQTSVEQVLLDQNGVKITFTGVKEERSYVNIKLKIENNSEVPITVQERNLSINGIMTRSIFSPDVAVGKTANDEISIFSSDLEENGIEQIENVELSFIVFNKDSFSTIFESELISFNAK